MKQLVFIAGRAHSGSTLLDLMLSGHPRLMGVGEVFSLYDPKQKNWFEHADQTKCSCGEFMDRCAFWGPASRRLQEIKVNGGSAQSFYQAFLTAFHEHFGTEFVPVDISKTDDALQTLIGLEDVSLKVIFLIRDVRSWTVSMRDVNRRAGEFDFLDLVGKYGMKGLGAYFGRTSIKYFWHWFLLNRRTQSVFQRAKLETIQIGYEELSLYPELVMRRVCDFLQIDFMSDMVSLRGKSSHVLLGNRMRFEPSKLARIAYDDRWFYSLEEWQLPSILFPHIMRYNSREVYRNVRGHLWK